jgi:hypothetical protein
MGLMAEKKAKVAKERQEKLVSVVRAEIIKPLGPSWEEVGPVLKRIRWASARCLNAATVACLLADRTQKKVASATEAYRAVNKQLELETEYDPSVSVASEIRVSWSKLAADAYAAHRTAIWRGDQSLPSYNKGAPIAVSAVGWNLKRDDKGYVLSTRLAAGYVGRTRFALAVEGGNAHARLRELCDPEHPARRGDLKIVYDERKRKWHALITVVRPKPPPPKLDPNKLLAVHRGIKAMLTYATSDGDTGVLVEGGEVLAFKAQMHARRRSWYAHKRQMPRRSRGRGTWRRYEQYRELGDKEARWTHTKLQQNAAAVVRLALAKGCGTVVLDDWSSRQLAGDVEKWKGAYAAWMVRRWPFAAQRDAIAWALQKAGIALKVVAAFHESCRCPACGNVDSQQDDGRGTFTCSKCDIKRSIEAIAAWNQLAQAGDAEAFDLNKAARTKVAEEVLGARDGN